MGGDESKLQEDYFLLENVNRLALKHTKTIEYFWVDSAVNEENIRNLSKFREYFKLDQFTSFKMLKQELSFCSSNQIVKVICAASLPHEDYEHMQSQSKVAQILLFCNNEEAAKSLMGQFPKIKGYGLDLGSVIQTLRQLQSQDNLNIPLDNMLFMIEQDTKSLNKYRLNYFCITNKQSKQKAKEDFVALAEKIYPERSDQIANFKQTYRVDWKESEKSQITEQVFQWIFKKSFFWELTENLPKTTTDPKKLAYLRLPFKDVYEAIFQTFQKEKKKYIQTFVVVDLNEQQRAKIVKSVNNFVIFTSFVKGFTKHEKARQQQKSRKNSFLFTIIPNRKKCQESLNFGYCINEKAEKQNIVFNIYNLFRVDEVVAEAGQVTMVYGGLAEAFAKNKDPNMRMQISANQVSLLRNYDYLEDMMKRVDSQATLLQLSGYFKESLEIYDKKADYIRKSNESQDVMSGCMIHKGDALRMSGEYEEAEREYLTIKSQKMRPVALVHLAELYFLQGNDQKLQKTLEQVKPMLPDLMSISKEDYFRAENYLGVRLLNKGSLNQARKKFKKLRQQIIQYYDYRFQGRPLVHEIYRNIATCQSLLNNHQEALNLLNSTREWQIDCEGNSASLALTQTMIQAVNKSKGDISKMQQSRTRLTMISQSVDSAQKKYLNKSLVMVDLNQSQVKIDL